MATPNYDVNYDDKRFTQVESDKKVALTQNEQTYNNMINQADKFYQQQIDASKEYAETQKKNQQAQTDFAIEQINQQKDQAKKDYTKEQSGAYVDWQKQSNQYGANSEKIAAGGLDNAGFAESSQVSMYNTYQNRVATARESYNLAVLNYDNAIKDARLQNSSALAEIAYNALQQQLELSLQGFQYKNTLLIEKANKRQEIDNIYHNRYQEVLQQINHENALAEEVRQYNATLALQQAELQLAQDKFDYQKEQDAKTATILKTGGGSGGSGRKPSSTNQKTTKQRIAADNPQVKANNSGKKEPTGISNRNGNGWVEVPGHGRFSYAELLDLVEDGQVKETVTSDGKLKYTWVTKKKTTPKVTDPYTFKQKQLYDTMR
jgi:hypothetical protein